MGFNRKTRRPGQRSRTGGKQNTDIHQLSYLTFSIIQLPGKITERDQSQSVEKQADTDQQTYGYH